MKVKRPPTHSILTHISNIFSARTRKSQKNEFASIWLKNKLQKLSFINKIITRNYFSTIWKHQLFQNIFYFLFCDLLTTKELMFSESAFIKLSSWNEINFAFILSCEIQPISKKKSLDENTISKTVGCVIQMANIRHRIDASAVESSVWYFIVIDSWW